MALPKICIVDFGGNDIQTADLIKLAAALQAQVDQFAIPPPVGYGIEVAQIRVGSAPNNPVTWLGRPLLPPAPEEWVMALLSQPDQAGAYGYHDRTPQGLPLMKTFPLLDKRDGHPWTVTCSHELLECLKDPEISLCAQGPDGQVYAYEVCDATEQDHYTLLEVEVSNWVTPCYFETPSDMIGKKYDWMGKLTGPAPAMTPGGYNQTYDPNQGWRQIFAEKAPRQYRAETIGRGMKRIAKHTKVFK
jgi:hypothetical protein